MLCGGTSRVTDVLGGSHPLGDPTHEADETAEVALLRDRLIRERASHVMTVNAFGHERRPAEDDSGDEKEKSGEELPGRQLAAVAPLGDAGLADAVLPEPGDPLEVAWGGEGR